MNGKMTIHCTKEYLIYRFIDCEPSQWYSDITAINDRDINGKLYGTEVFIYEESLIDYSIFESQFADSQSIEANSDGLIYIQLRKFIDTSHGPGFGRRVDIGLSKQGLLACIRIPWNSPGAGMPTVEPNVALKGLEYEDII